MLNIDLSQQKDEEILDFRDSFYNTICESCLLPLSESALKSSSLHEMAKEYDNYLAYCKTITIISNKKYLKDLLKPISVHYKPT